MSNLIALLGVLATWRLGVKPASLLILLTLLLLIPGCQRTPRATVTPYLMTGDYARARDIVEQQIVNDRSDRRYMLDRMRAGVLNLDAGNPQRAEAWFAEVYDVLRTQGLNEDKTVQSIVLTEGVKVWKGEPFEQALALVYYGFVQAEQGSWDNARAAASNALFYLRDFEGEENGEDRTIDTAEIARRAAAYERQQRGESPAFESGDEYLDHGYIVEENNFTLAYLLHAIASQQLDRPDEASDYFNRALSLEPGLRPIIQRMRSGDYNTVLVVAGGVGPKKIATGPDGAIAAYRPRTFSSDAPLAIDEPGAGRVTIPMITNVNSLALDHRWNNLEDIRIAKSVLGELAVTGGLAAVLIGADQGNEAAMLAGGAAILIGALLKATAKANTDHADVFPQRLYLVPLTITDPNQPVTLHFRGTGYGNAGDQTVVLDQWQVPRGPDAAFRYIRLPKARNPTTPVGPPVAEDQPGRKRLFPIFR